MSRPSIGPGETLIASDEAAKAGDLDAAIVALREVLGFIPEGEDQVPESCFCSDRDREIRDAEPGRFARDRLEVVLRAYEELASSPPEPATPPSSEPERATKPNLEPFPFTVEEVREAITKYFDVDDLDEAMKEIWPRLMHDWKVWSFWTGQRVSYSANPYRGEAWWEERGRLRQHPDRPDSIDIVLKIARSYVKPRLYIAPEIIGTWELTLIDGEPAPEPRAVWTFHADGRFEGRGLEEEAETFWTEWEPKLIRLTGVPVGHTGYQLFKITDSMMRTKLAAKFGEPKLVFTKVTAEP